MAYGIWLAVVTMAVLVARSTNVVAAEIIVALAALVVGPAAGFGIREYTRTRRNIEDNTRYVQGRRS